MESPAIERNAARAPEPSLEDSSRGIGLLPARIDFGSINIIINNNDMAQNNGVISGMAFNRRESYYGETTFQSTVLGGMATMNKTIMTFLFCISFLSLANNAGAQEAGKISFEQFENFSISDAISIRGLLDLGNNWDYLKQSLGTPVEENCRDGNDFMGIEPTCDF